MAHQTQTKSAASTADHEREHEGLLLEAARLFPEILAQVFQDLEPVYATTRADLAKNGWSDKLEQTIREGKIEDLSQRALWREAVRDVPRFAPLPLAEVTFGHSFFQRKHPAIDREAKRLGMADLRVDWECPGDRFHLKCYSDFSGKIPTLKRAHDAYRLHLRPMRLFAVAFHSGIRLGRLLERVESLRDHIRNDAESRILTRAPLVVITAREEIFEALAPKHDALLIGADTYGFQLENTMAVDSRLSVDRTF